MRRFFRVFHIEYILIGIALATFSCMAFFKARATKQFALLDQKFLDLQEAEAKSSETINLRTGGGINKHISEIEALCVPYTYFDKTLEADLRALCTVREDFGIALSRIQSEIHQKQRGISFGYDSCFYFSAILMLVVTGVIITKKLLEASEFEKQKAINEEQKIFSRNLHDGVAQDLAAIKIYQKKGDSEKLKFYTDRALNEVRYLIDSSRLELDQGIEAALKEMLDAFESNHGIRTHFLCTSNSMQNLKEEFQAEIFRVMQEVLSNIARHANASEVQVRITDVADELRILVSDNGRGFHAESFDSESVDLANDSHKHWGLQNIRERVKNMHGTVDFIHDGGTTVAVSITHPLS